MKPSKLVAKQLVKEQRASVRADQAKRQKAKEKKIKELMENPNSSFNQLTPKQKGYIEDHAVYGIDKREAIAHNYQSKGPKSVSSTKQELESSSNVQRVIREIYAAGGVTRERIAKRISEGMDAGKLVVDKDTGEVIREEVDHRVRLEATKMAMDVYGDRNLKDEKSGDVMNIQINIQESDKVEEAVLDYMERKHGKKKAPDKVEVIEGEVTEQDG